MRKFEPDMKIRFHLLALAAVMASGVASAQAQDVPQWRFSEGVHYDRLIPSAGHFQSARQDRGGGVSLVRLPVLLSHGRLYR